MVFERDVTNVKINVFVILTVTVNCPASIAEKGVPAITWRFGCLHIREMN